MLEQKDIIIILLICVCVILLVSITMLSEENDEIYSLMQEIMLSNYIESQTAKIKLLEVVKAQMYADKLACMEEIKKHTEKKIEKMAETTTGGWFSRLFAKKETPVSNQDAPSIQQPQIIARRTPEQQPVQRIPESNYQQQQPIVSSNNVEIQRINAELMNERQLRITMENKYKQLSAEIDRVDKINSAKISKIVDDANEHCKKLRKEDADKIVKKATDLVNEQVSLCKKEKDGMVKSFNASCNEQIKNAQRTGGAQQPQTGDSSLNPQGVDYRAKSTEYRQNSDGTTTTISPDGTKTINNSNGTVTTIAPNGSSSTRGIVRNQEAERTRTYADSYGGKIIIPSGHQPDKVVEVDLGDGTSVIESSYNNTDGSTTVTSSDGKYYTLYNNTSITQTNNMIR